MTVGSNGRPPLILIVEDEFLLALELEAVIEASGWDVLGPAASISEAMRFLDSDTPNAALLDYNLGGHPVTPVAERLRAMAVPFAVISAYAASNIAKIEVLSNAPILQKPARSGLIAKTVTGLIQL